MFKRIAPTKLSGQETFINTGKTGLTINDLWCYAFSNLNSNVYRGALAEFLVEVALNGLENSGIRNPWGDYDVLYKEKNLKVEVKCSSYIQDWDQNDYSKPVFAGLKAKDLYWSSAVGPFNTDNTKAYKADMYVLALFKEKDVNKLSIIDLDQWCFYVLSRKGIEDITKNGSTLSLNKLEKHKVIPCSFDNLKSTVDALL